MYQDKTLICRDCGAEFIWSAGEQEFFAQKGFDKPPTRCPECRKKRRTERDGGKSGTAPSSGPKQMHDIVCSNCGKTGQVPFEPKSANVLCADCFKNRHTVVATDKGVEVKEVVAEAPATSESPTETPAATEPAEDATE